MSDLRPRCWLDEDGKHVWFGHQCRTGWMASMLPHPTWRTVMAAWLDRLVVRPSITCALCGLECVDHPIGIEPPPLDAVDLERWLAAD